MGKILDFIEYKEFNFDDSEEPTEIKRTKEFLEAAKMLSDFIKQLPLSHENNDKLIHMIFNQTELAEFGAYDQGFVTGITLNRNGGI